MSKYIDHKDGVEYVNVSPYGVTELGRVLSPGYIRPFETIVGKVSSMRNAMDFLTREKYPKTFLGKTKMTTKDIEKISKLKKLHIPNYWAAVAYFLIEKIIQDKDTITALKELPPSIPFRSFRMIKHERHGIVNYLVEENYELDKYLRILKTIHFKVYNGELKYNDVELDTIKKIVNTFKEDKTKDILYGIDKEYQLEADL